MYCHLVLSIPARAISSTQIIYTFVMKTWSWVIIRYLPQITCAFSRPKFVNYASMEKCEQKYQFHGNNFQCHEVNVSNVFSTIEFLGYGPIFLVIRTAPYEKINRKRSNVSIYSEHCLLFGTRTWITYFPHSSKDVVK